MNKGGELYYKCRICRKIYHDTGVPDLLLALIDINIFGVTQNKGIKARLTDIHNCFNGQLGIADLIGGKEDEE